MTRALTSRRIAVLAADGFEKVQLTIPDRDALSRAVGAGADLVVYMQFWVAQGAARRSQSRFTLQHRLRYSARNASTGSTLSARLAGCQAAKVARASSATAAAVNVIVSNGSTPCKRP